MILYILQFLCCAIMTGIIWTIQVVHYPTFKYISKDQFKDFHNFHSRKITYIVLPVMILELFSAMALLFLHSHSFFIRFNIIGILLIWLCTFFISVPFHKILSEKADSKAIDLLIYTNWLRTLLWSLRLGLLALVLIKMTGVIEGPLNIKF